ncbi:MAG: HD domain-containing protein [Acidimicrobiia bacterium]
MALVALGGYGRGELSPYSDVDLMLLHDRDDISDLAGDLFRPLWDAKLKVGHSVRTVKEAAVAARERFDTQTTLLTGRLISGSNDLFDSLKSEVAAVTRARPMRRHLVTAERLRREETPFLVMATDVKNGRGGLRTLQGFEWERRREELIGRFSPDPEPEESEALETLLRIRNALHVVAGRAHDVFSPELREAAARWLGFDPYEVANDLVEAVQTVDRLAEQRWPEISLGPPAPLAKRVWSRISGTAEPVSGTTTPSIDQFVLMLEDGEQGRLSFERLWGAGLLDEVLPEWEVVRTLPQMEAFHEHPVATHLWRAVHEMLELMAGDDHFGRVARELDRPDLLPLVAFLHDIGKGHGGDHAAVGADIARAFCVRMGMAPEPSELVAGAVRLHLLLPLTATRRDLDDPAVIDDVVSQVGSLELLQILYLLAVADSRATGASMWTEWKASLLQTLFLRCATGFGGDLSVDDPGAMRAAVLEAAGAQRRELAAAHFDGMPGEYQRSTDATDVLWHLDLLAQLVGLSNLGVRVDSPYDSAVVVGPALPGRRQIVAGALAANGIDVLEARLHTRDDGMVVDTFRVRDDRTKTRVPSERWGRVGADIESGLGGELDTASKVATRAAAYPDSSLADKPTARVEIDAATGDLVVTVKCSDRIGRLAEILAVLGDCGLEIRLAKLDSRKGEVIDTFHVDAGDHIEDLAGLARRIAGGISP